MLATRLGFQSHCEDELLLRLLCVPPSNGIMFPALSNSSRVVCTPGAEVAEKMRHRVFNETQLTCSVGLGPNTMLAKVASDINKPNGQYVLPDDPTALKEFVQSLSLRKVPGIGKVCNPLGDPRVDNATRSCTLAAHLHALGGLLEAVALHSPWELRLIMSCGNN